jgi:transcriptional regulator with XRE-family HTH domain
MEKSFGTRIKELRAYYKLGIKEFGSRCGISHVAIFNLESGKTNKPQSASLQKIITCYGTTHEWLFYGIGEMLPNGMPGIGLLETKQEDVSWREDVFLELKNKNAMLEKEVERLWQMLQHLTQHSELKFKFTPKN